MVFASAGSRNFGLAGTPGDEARVKGMSPDVPETTFLDNPYTCTKYHSGRTHGQ